ncbi:MAG TPA: ThiF family adenylyltransferase [Candidatus Paceibacterota bacterium]|nr:ThiF family adenylyltransferase [Candidatus Paceibacterota bacterium]
MEERLTALKGTVVPSHPELFDLSKEKDKDRFSALLDTGEIAQIADDYEEEQRELFGIRHPAEVYAPGFEEKFGKHWESLAAEGPMHEHGRWAYFPWRRLASHILPEDEYRLVRTARNQNLISREEQEKFYNARIGIAGLSVGSSVAIAIALGGGGKRMKLADMDRLALTNTNRVLAGADRLGMLKVEMAARTIYEINPYAELELHSEGLTKENVASFMDGLDIMIDEIDNLAVKYLIREEAKKRKLPVLMAADNGDNAVVDIERYDLDPETPFFHGRMGEVSYEMLAGLDKFGIGKMITKLVGPENVTERMQASLLEMGKTIVSWPQLGGAALVNGAAVAYCARKVINGEPLEGNRALVSLDEKLVPGYDGPEETARREKVTESFRTMFGL